MITPPQKSLLLIEGIPGIVYSFSNIRGGIYYSSQSKYILGYTPEELYSQPLLWHNSIHPDDKLRIDHIIHEIKSDKPYQVEYRIRDAQGNWLWFEDRSLGYQHENNEILVNGIAIDITERKKHERLLSDAFYRLEGILEGTHAGTWEWNIQTGETTFNPTWAEIIGYSLDELKPTSIKTWELFAHPDDLIKSGELLNQHFSGVLPYYHFESRMKHKDGHWVWVLDRGKVVSWTNDKKSLLMFGTHTDITERKNTEIALNKQNQKLLTIFKASSDAITIASVQTGQYLEVNDVFLDFTGLPKEKVIGHTSIELKLWINQNDRQEYISTLNEKGFLRDYEVRFRIQNNEIRWFSVSSETIILEGITYSINFIRDIDERKIMEVAFKENEFALNDVQQKTGLGLWSYDPVSQQPKWSKEMFKIWGLDPELAPPNYNLHKKYIHPDDFPAFDTLVQRALEKGEPFVFEKRICRPNNTERTVITICEPQFDKSGKVIQLRGTNQDITERKEAENKIKSLLAEKELILKEVHHR